MTQKQISRKTFSWQNRVSEKVKGGLFFSILILNITDIILPTFLLNKRIPRMLEVLETSLFLAIKFVGSARDEFVSHDKKFVEKIDTNLA